MGGNARGRGGCEGKNECDLFSLKCSSYCSMSTLRGEGNGTSLPLLTEKNPPFFVAARRGAAVTQHNTTEKGRLSNKCIEMLFVMSEFV